MRLMVPLFILLAMVTSSALGSTLMVDGEPEVSVSAEQVRMELEADRHLLGPNFHMEDSYLVEGTILEVNQDSIKIEQHLDSPPQVVDPVINIHPYTLIQTRQVDSHHNLLAVDNAYFSTAKDLLQPGQVVVILYLTHNNTAKSIILFQ